jgi:hypothetical protein
MAKKIVIDTQVIEVPIEGISPLILHNGQTSDPLSPVTKAVQRLTAKRKKTDEDHEILSREEWFAGLYLSHDLEITENGFQAPKEARVVLTMDMLQAMILRGARKNKLGPLASAGILVVEDAELHYADEPQINELVAQKKYVFRRSVRVNQARVMRTRPRFMPWSATLKLSISPEVIDVSQVLDCLRSAGRLVGLGDWRPEKSGPYGRFVVNY